MKDDNLLQVLRNLDLGEGVSVTIQDGKNATFFYTNRINTGNKLPKGLEIEVSSVVSEDEVLLQHLMQITRKELEK